MKDKTTTYGSNPENIAKLLNIINDPDSVDVDTKPDKSELINEKLNETVPIYFSTEQDPVHKLHRLRHTIAVLSGEPIGKLLDNPKTDITLIRMIKDYGRKLSDKSKPETERQITKTISFAAIAHALVYHNIKISSYPYEKLRKDYSRLSKETWIPKNLLDLFIKAAEYCTAKIE